MIVVGLTGGMGQGKSTLGLMLRDLAGVDQKADLESAYPITEVLNDWMATWPNPLVLGDQGDYTSLANHLIETLPPIIKQRTDKFTTIADMRIGYDKASQDLHSRLLDYLQKWLGLGDDERAVQLPTPINADNKGLHRHLLQWLGGVAVAVVSPTIWSDLIDRRIKQLAERGYSLVTVGGVRYKHDADTIHANGGKVVRVVRPDTHLSNDVTETSMSEITSDSEVTNNGTIDQLQAVATQLYADLQAGSVKPSYVAADQV